MQTIIIIAIIAIVLGLYHLAKAWFKAIKEIITAPIKGAGKTLKGFKALAYKRRVAKFRRLLKKEAIKHLHNHAMVQLSAETNGFVKSDKLKNLEAKIK